MTAAPAARHRATQRSPRRPVDQRHLDLGIASGIVLLGALAGWWRLSAHARGVVWAEDGWEFLQDRLDDPGRIHLFDSYEGYLHVVPRMVVAVAATIAPPADFALTLTALCVTVTAVVAALVYLCSSSVLTSRTARLVLAATTVLAPAAEQEVLGNAANLHSYFLWLAPWLLLARPRRWSVSVLLGVFALLGSLSEIQVALFLPLALLVVRTPRWWPPVIGTALGVAAQLVTTLRSPRSDNPLDPATWSSRLRGVLLDPLLSAGTAHGQDWVVVHIGWWLPGLLALVVLGVAVWVLRRGGGTRAGATLACLAGAVVPYLAAVTLNPDPRTDYSGYTAVQWAAYETPRYSVAASMFVTAIIVVALDLLLATHSSTRHRAPVRSRLAGAGLLAVVLIQLLNAPATHSYRDDGERWSPQIDLAVSRCRAAPTDERVVLALAPTFGAVTTNCRALLNWAED